ncbi:MAG: PHP domain-containing protein, partial [Propionicimonas sp.]|nr:PHP domain-containing protein [Propionicimonas sp.]
MRIDLHTHSRVSDGTDSPAGLVQAARAAGLDVVALTDHDTFDGLAEAMAAGPEAGVVVVPGVEMSTRVDGTSVHLLGYGCRPDDAALGAELAAVRRGRDGRVPAMLRALEGLGMPIPAEVLERTRAGSPSIGRPHVADAMVELGYVADRRAAFDAYLRDGGPAYVPRYAPVLAQAIDLIHAAGGVTVLAHPWGRGSRPSLSESRLARLAADHGLDGVEVDHYDHASQTRQELRRLAERHGLLATGSSDYHGTGKVGHPLGLNTTAPEVLAEIERR